MAAFLPITSSHAAKHFPLVTFHTSNQNSVCTLTILALKAVILKLEQQKNGASFGDNKASLVLKHSVIRRVQSCGTLNAIDGYPLTGCPKAYSATLYVLTGRTQPGL